MERETLRAAAASSATDDASLPPTLRLIETLHLGSHSRVVRARHSDDAGDARGPRAATVVAKMPRAPIPDSWTLARYRYEHHVLRDLGAVEGGVRPLTLEEHRGRPILLLEDRGGRALDGRLADGPLALDAALTITLRIARTLAALHACGRVHGQVDPHHIVVSDDHHAVELIDFAGVVPRGARPAQGGPTGVRATTSRRARIYRAPEQIGLRGRALDGRTDLYGLGATAWHLLVGRPPFDDRDALALHHARLAHVPAAPHALRPEVPPVVSAIVLRLLAKEPQDRYQSALGLIADLERWRALAAEDDGVARLATRDGPTAFVLPDRLYGREAPQQTLLHALAEARVGALTAVRIRGPAGIGKTSLLRTLEGPVAAAAGHFSVAACEPHRRDVPYDVVIRALRAPLRAHLQMAPDRLAHWCAMPEMTATGGYGRALLAELLPETGRDTAEDSNALPNLTVADVQARAHALFAALLGELASATRPLVLVLDDLQWIDAASHVLLEDLVRGAPSLRHVLLLLSARAEASDAEPGFEAPAINTDDALQDRAAPLLSDDTSVAHVVHIPPLTRDAIAALVVDTCRCAPDAAAPLARWLLTRTAGNPLHVRTLLQGLHDDGHLRREAGGYRWSQDALDALAHDDVLLGRLQRRVDALPVPTRRVLCVLACLGLRAHLDTLALCCDAARDEVDAIDGDMAIAALVRHLEPALDQGLIHTEGPPVEVLAFHRPPAVDAAGDGDAFAEAAQQAVIVFAHGRVRDAAYAQLSAAERPQAHRRIVRQLRRRRRAAARVPRGDTLYLQIDHFVRAAAALDDSDRCDAAGCALLAGDRAGRTGAFDSAFHYYERGLSWLDADQRRADPSLHVALASGAARTAFLIGREDVLDARIDDVLTHARTLDEAMRVHETRIQRLMASAAFAEAFQVLDDLLVRAGRPRQQVVTPLRLARELAHTGFLLWRTTRGRSERLEQLPRAVSPDAKVRQTLYHWCLNVNYASYPRHIPLTVLRAVRDALRDGVTADGALVWHSYAMMLITALDRFESAQRYVRIGSTLLDRVARPDLRACAEMIDTVFVRTWVQPIGGLVEPLRALAPRLADAGYPMHSAFVTMQSHWFAFLVGQPLTELRPQAAALQAAYAAAGNPDYAELHRPLRDWIEMLVGVVPESDAPRGDPDTASALPGRRALAYVGLHRALVFGDADAALRHARYGLQRTPDSIGPYDPMWLVFQLYAACALERALAEGRTRGPAVRLQLRRARRTVHQWCRRSPVRGYARAWLDAARLTRRGESARALASYERALDGAWDVGCRHDAALIAEHAAALCAARGDRRRAETFRREAYAAYRQWGAEGKLARMRVDDPALARVDDLGIALPAAAQRRRDRRLAGARSAARATISQALDLRVLQRVGDRLGAADVDPAALPDQLLGALMEHAGATLAALVIDGASGPRIEALRAAQSSRLDSVRGTEASRSALPLRDHPELLPETVVGRVLRTGAAVQIDDARTDPAHRADPAVVRHAPRALLCVPIRRAGRVAAALYLENDILVRCFHAEQRRTIALLAAQLVLAVDNVALSAQLDAQVAARTEALARAQAAAESASLAKSRFLAHMSHELRTPLNAVLGHAERLHQPGVDDATRREAATHIRRGARALLRIIDDVLDMARIEADVLALRPVDCDLGALVRGIVDEYEPLARRHRVRLVADLDPALPRLVQVDDQRLRQVLINLVGNAVRFGADGRVTVRAAIDSETPVAPGSLAGGEAAADPARHAAVRFAVQDQGPGIAPEDQRRIFDAFEQVAGGQQAGGTGLGLAISHRLVARMGGTLQVESLLGHGSCFGFTLVLPASGAAEPLPAAARGGAAAVGDTAAGVAQLPPSTRAALRALADMGHMRALIAQLDALADQPDLAQPVAALRALADAFDDRAIVRLLDDAPR
ncbi:MAG: AAA family ATPase [Acidobacteriota bacterium]